MNKSKYYLVTGAGSVQKAISEYLQQEADFKLHLKIMSEKYGSEKAYVTNMILGFYSIKGKQPHKWDQKNQHPKGVFSPDFRLDYCKRQIIELQSVRLPNRMFFHHIFNGSVILTEGKFREPEFKQMEDNLIWKMPVNKYGEHCEIDMAGLKPISNITYLKLEGK